jgi:hypothetical protein
LEKKVEKIIPCMHPLVIFCFHDSEKNTFLVVPNKVAGVWYCQKYEELVTPFIPLIFVYGPQWFMGFRNEYSFRCHK